VKAENRWTRVGAALLVFVIVAPLIVAAFVADGFDRTKVNEDDAGIWVVKRSEGVIGRVNTQIGAIEVKVVSGSKADDVVQLGDTVLIVDTEKGGVSVVDIAQVAVSEGAAFPGGSTVALGGDNAAVTAPSGDVWVLDGPRAAQVDPDDTKSTFRASKGATTAVDTEGVAHVYDPRKGTVTEVAVGGKRGSRSIDEGLGAATITTVGTEEVVLASKNKTLVLPGGEEVELAAHGPQPVLQHPGPESDRVLVATGRELLSIGLDDGEVTVLHKGAPGRAVAPVWLGGCAYGAWNEGAMASVRACDGAAPEVTSSKVMAGLNTSANLVFRVNRNRVLLNDLSTGANLLFTEDEPEPIQNWDEAQSEDEEELDQKREIVPKERECEKEAPAPRIGKRTIQVGARPGRPVNVDVLGLSEVKADKCDVVRVELLDPPKAKDATAEVVSDGEAIQLTPTADAARTFDLEYSLVGENGSDDGLIQVVVREESENDPPVLAEEATVVMAGSDVVHNVLLGARDPDGDALTLTGASAGPGAGDLTIKYQPTGAITVAVGSSSADTKEVLYEVRDEHGSAPVKGTLTVEVVAAGTNLPPTPRHDRIQAVVGRPVTFDLLANDTDPNGDELTVLEVKGPPEVGLTWDDADSGLITVEATKAGTYFFPYQEIDQPGEEPVEGTVRVDVLAADGSVPPVAVRDDAVARAGLPTMVDLLDNDFDLDGDVLAATTIRADDATTDVTVELLEMRVARITTPPGFTETTTFTYTVTDATADHERTGKLVVRPHQSEASNLAPQVEPDEVTLRAGTASALKVLANDVDPEGEQLEVLPLRDDQGADDPAVEVFAVGKELRVVAGAGASGTYRAGYSAADPGGVSQDGTVTITIVDADATNRPPSDPKVKGRVREGESVDLIVPLVGLDLDGDAVAISSLLEPPELGSVEVAGGVITYAAAPGSSGLDSFTIQLDDGRGGVTLSVVEMVVVPAGDQQTAPTAVPDEASVEPGGERTIDVLQNDTDPDGDDLVLLTDGVDAPTEPQRGRVEIVDNRMVYRPAADLAIEDPEVGVQDSFSYGITDGAGGTDRGIVTLTIKPDIPNEDPIAADDVAETQAPGGRVEIGLLENDYDPDGDGSGLSVEIPNLDRVESETGATIDLQDNGVAIVKVPAGEPRSVSFRYLLRDAEDGNSSAVATVPVLANLPPEARLDKKEVDAGQDVEVDVLENDRDPEGTKLGLVQVGANRGGKAEPQKDGTVVFTAARDVRGLAGFAYQVEDADGLRSWGYAEIEVVGQNFAPTLEGTTASVSAGGTIELGLDVLADDDNPSDIPDLEFDLVEVGGSGVTAEQGGARGEKLVIEAEPDAAGTNAELKVSVSDGGQDGEAEAVIQVEVSAFEGVPPTAVDNTSRTFEGDPVSLDVTEDDIDPAEEGLSIVGVPTSASGSVSVGSDKRTLTFTPASGYHGETSITYTVEDVTKDAARRSSATWRITVIGRPDAPNAPTGEADHQVVNLTWPAPAANGATITGYLIESQPAGSGSATQQSAGTSHAFTGLTNGTSYRFRVLALNEATQRDEQRTNWSAWSAPYIPDVVPEAPNAPTVAFADQAIDVSWAEPENQGTAITAYELQITGPGVNRTENVGNKLAYTWEGLTNGATYQFSVRATNDRDWGAWSSPSDRSSEGAVPAGRPLAPVDVSAVRAGDDVVGGAVTVSWNWTRDGQGNGADATSFDITATAPGVPTVTATKANSPHPFTGLKNGSTYTFAVVAHTKVPEASPPGTDTEIPTKRPNAPGAVTATNADRASVVTITPPAADGTGPGDGGSPITSYRITSGSNTWTLNGTSGRIGLDGTGPQLVNGQTYVLSVAACNNATGNVTCGPTTDVGNVRPYGAPSTPGPIVSANGPNLSWSWGESSGNGRAITGYDWEARRIPYAGGSPSGSAGAGSGSVGPGDRTYGLVAGDHYEIRVRARNEEVAGDWSGWVGTDTRSFSVAKSNRSASGEPSVDGGTCGSQCRWMDITLRNLRPSTSYTVECRNSSATADDFARSFTIATDGAGNASTGNQCFYGYPNTYFWVRVNGKDSNRVLY
jgi:hypothetical protein